MRLDKLISNSTAFTRSQTGKLIRKGNITVNNVVIKQAAYKVLPDDQVQYMAAILNLASKAS